jgi:hypothetical protein
MTEKLTGPEMWRRCWEREERERELGRYKQNHKALQHPFAAELHEVQRIGRRVRAYAMFRYHALSMQRQEGWAAHFYKSIWGDWPSIDWKKVPPMQPTGAVKRLIETHDRRWVKEQKLKAWREEKIANTERDASDE